MLGMEWVLELALIGLLGATLFHAVRLERALGVLKRDRATLEALVAGFNTSTQQAESGIERLRAAADGAGRQIARQVELGTSLKDDLGFLIDRAERSADRLDGLVRSARPLAMERPRAMERPLAMERTLAGEPHRSMAAAVALPDPEPAETPRVRSQAERDLLRALRMAR
jgi:hypothetical protein